MRVQQPLLPQFTNAPGPEPDAVQSGAAQAFPESSLPSSLPSNLPSGLAHVPMAESQQPATMGKTIYAHPTAAARTSALPKFTKARK